jgi:hypothetical protein
MANNAMAAANPGLIGILDLSSAPPSGGDAGHILGPGQSANDIRFQVIRLG